MINFFKKLFRNPKPEDQPIKKPAGPKIITDQKYKDDLISCFIIEGRKYGASVRNAQNEYVEVIPPIYHSTHYDAATDTIVAVLAGGEDSYKSGMQIFRYFDLEGQLVKEFKKIDHIATNGDLLVLTINRKKGILNTQFETVIPCEYQTLWIITNEIFIGEKFDVERDPYTVTNYTFNGIFNANNEVLGEFGFGPDVFRDLYNDCVIVGAKIQGYSSYNIVTKKQVKLPVDELFSDYYDHRNGLPLYRSVTNIDYESEYFNSGLFGTDLDEFLIGKWGAIAPDGHIAIPNQYDYLERINATLYKVAMGTPVTQEDEEPRITTLSGFKWGIIDVNNQVIRPCEYDWIKYNYQQQEIVLNRGGSVTWNHWDHKPEWLVSGGEFERMPL